MTDNFPNIVLIVLDAVRQDHLSAYGYGRETTPHIDRLAADGMLFTRAYSNSCWTIPAHASLFTGLYPSVHGADLGRPLDPRHPTLAGSLKELGYRSADISCNSFAAGASTELNRGFDLTVDVEGSGRQGSDLVSRGIRFVQKGVHALTRRDRGAGRATDLAMQWMAEQRGQPFFLFMNYMDCHLPYRLAKSKRYRFLSPAERSEADRIPHDPFAAMAGALSITPRQVSLLEAQYDGALHYLDSMVGRLVGRLQELGLYDDTVIIVTSDHGESFGEHGLFDHQFGLYEHLLRVPLVVRLPAGAMGGQRVNRPVQLMDLSPALMRMLHAGRSRAADAFLAGPQRAAVIAEYPVPNMKPFRRRFPDAPVGHLDVALRSISVDQYKLISRQDGGVELYDLQADPGEIVNLASAKPAIVEQLKARLAATLGPWGAGDDADVQDAGVLTSAEERELRERLEGLGYL